MCSLPSFLFPLEGRLSSLCVHGMWELLPSLLHWSLTKDLAAAHSRSLRPISLGTDVGAKCTFHLGQV